jgi:hypothetical protein
MDANKLGAAAVIPARCPLASGQRAVNALRLEAAEHCGNPEIRSLIRELRE